MVRSFSRDGRTIRNPSQSVRKERQMNLRPGFDDDLQAKKQRWSLPVRSIGHLMVVVASSGLTFAMAAGMVARQRQVRPNPVRIPRPIAQVKAVVAQPR